ncbi:leucyl aminopeptidase family protein [Pradoshia sp. D12]|uniref:M17 family metallopeptidase n=1 Tax=Bacillaceae TaxID=186817 RepID=UPI00112C6EF1|nr:MULTISPECIES: leucyl aminopeptidase family protein [Bacillaceae]QFK71957.1 leucyl aminopeptidase family protein [Pradoshia sp. D12]TPF71551.1 leucyl aminopeptidase family protein [Bacillus sp. D12]
MHINIVPIHETNDNIVYFEEKSCIEFGKVQLITKGEELIVYIGIGQDSLTMEDIRFLGGISRKSLINAKAAAVSAEFSLIMDRAEKPELGKIISCFMEGWYLAEYQFSPYKMAVELNQLTMLCEDERLIEYDRTARIRANAVNLARDLCNEPANKLTPTAYAERLKQVFSGTDVSVQVIDDNELLSNQFVGIHTVAKGSSEPAKLVVLTLERDVSKEKIALVGKGVTFDSGGTNVKTGNDIGEMKMDMGGSAAVTGAMKLLADSNKAVNVVAILPLVENLADGNAFLPSDIIRYRNGLHVEVGNTDAEGRLILADGLLYAQLLGAKTIMDIATLTGSIGSALGLKAAGVFSNAESDLWHYKQLGDQTGDYVWPMPVFDDYLYYLKSDCGDINNMSSSPYGGSITAALFLKQFVEKGIKWVHIDMANTVRPWREQGYYVPGASGFGVRLLFEMVSSELSLS